MTKRCLGKYWSFSRISTFDNCPYEFKLTYIDNIDGESNVFAEYGTFVHSILEKLYKGELTVFDLVDYYDEHYKEKVVSEFPPYIDADKYYQTGRAYFENYEPITSKYDVVGVEKRVNIDIEGNRFMGIIDLLLKDKETGEFIVYDHKSKSGFKSKKELKKYARQLYLYAYYVKQKYNVLPSKLVFNLFRKGEEVEINFNEKEYEDTLKWFKNEIEAIKSTAEDGFNQKAEADFYCKNLCNVRMWCEKGVE